MRIRTIKPAFWSSATIASVSRDARLVFIGLWNIADDEGRLLGGAKGLAGALFEHDEDVDGKAMGRWLDELERAGLVRRYDVKGVAHIAIPGFGEHQKIDKRFPSRLPAPPAPVGESPPLLSDGSEGSGCVVGALQASEVGSQKSEVGSRKLEVGGEAPASPPAPETPTPAAVKEKAKEALTTNSTTPTIDPCLSAGDPSRLHPVVDDEGGGLGPVRPPKPHAPGSIPGPPANTSTAMVLAAPQVLAPLPNSTSPPTTTGRRLMRNTGSILDQDRRALEPKTPAEYLARAYDYPHGVAKPGEKTFAEALLEDPNVAKAFDGKEGRWSLERAVAGTAWGHWQSQDEMGRDRWVWPTKAPLAIEGWVKDSARKAALEMDRQKVTRKGAEARGIDVDKPDQKIDPLRTTLATVWNGRYGKGEDLPPMATWIDDVIARGDAQDVIDAFRAASPAATAGVAAVVRNDVGARDAAAKAAFDAYCASIPPQERQQMGEPTWSQWHEQGRPARFTGRKGSGAPPSSPPSSTKANQPPAPAPVADDAVVDARATIAALAAGVKPPPPKPKTPASPRRQMAREFARAALVTKGNKNPTDAEVLDHIVALGGVDAIVDGKEDDGAGVGGAP